MRKFVILCIGVLASALVGGEARAAVPAESSAGGAPSLGRYIVVLRDGADAAQVAAMHGKAHGFTPQLVYNRALSGYAATLPEPALAGIRSRPEVRFVSVDGEVQAAQTQPPQAVSFGVLRIGGDKSSTRSGDGRGTVNVNVAVLDDGMDATHPDLNVVGGTSCVNGAGRPGRDGFPSGQHGTMVGGFIGALDNAIGRVGVAPGARLWAVRVLHDDGFGSDSEIICGLDWVTATRTDSDPTNDIAVANMSLGGKLGKGFPAGTCTDSTNQAKYLAVCRAVAAGVTVVAAAGNEGADILNLWPANMPDVLTVTAVSDKDGLPGSLGGQLNCLPSEIDDTAATFSNFATLASDQTHVVAAPGSCIASTWPGGLYAVGSGTSFATPLAAGTVALCVASGPCAGLTPRQIIQKIVADASAYNSTKKNSGYGFAGDPLRPIDGKYYGYLIRASLY